ncbi:MAG: acetate/propionate family kinase [Pseudomonadota bacterium]
MPALRGLSLDPEAGGGMTTAAILTLNAGSSSLKLALYPAAEDRPLVTGLVDRIGGNGTLHLRDAAGADIPVAASSGDFASHAAALNRVLPALDTAFPGLQVLAVGHRIVHGGPDHVAPVLVDEAMLVRLAGLSPLAPLHQPHNIAGIRAAMAAFPGAPQVACFDTAFHRGQPFVAEAYALPRAYYDKGVRRYGFHGLSYQSIAGRLADIAPGIAGGRVIVAHLGNGASMCAMRDGRSVASTMGFSPLDGLPMGTRSGQIDPGVLLYLMQEEGMQAPAISDLLYRGAGLLGLSGLSSDMRVLEASDSVIAREAIAYFVYRCQREIGSLAAALGGLDALVFCGGIGENSRRIRADICAGLGWMGIALDGARNAANATWLGTDDAPVRVMAIPTDEESVIAAAARRLTSGDRTETG